MTTILQISDPHLMNDRQGVLKDVPTAMTLASVLETARRRWPDPECIVWTGDLSHQESVDGYQLLSELVGDWIDKSHLIPGNHDNRAALRQAFPDTLGEGDDLVSFRTHLDGWQLIGLDTHIRGDAAGELSDEQVDQLHDWLAANPGQPTLVFMHHPPIPIGCSWLDGIRLRNPDRLESLMNCNPGVRGIFCGHVHSVHEDIFAGARVFTAPSAAFQFNVGSPDVKFDLIPPGFRGITLDQDDFSTEVVRVADLKYRPCDD